MQIIPGTIQKLIVNDLNDRGYLLGDDRNFVFMPKQDSPAILQEGDQVEVFTFYNENQELEATTKLPVIQLGQMICVKAKNVNNMGAFADIGTKRDILIPLKEQREPIKAGQMVLMILREDKVNHRLFGSTRISSHITNKNMSYKRGDEVELTIADKIDVGRRVVVNGLHFAILFNAEIMDKISFGQKVKGYVRMIEGKDLTVSMQREGMDLLNDAKDSIIKFLKANNGYARLNDDTDPDEIKLRLKISKKTFKKAAGMLFKEGVVTLTKLGIKLNKEMVPQSEWVNTKPDEEDERRGAKPKKQFVDKRNYKGRINEFDKRNRLTPREKEKSTETGTQKRISKRPYSREGDRRNQSVRKGIASKGSSHRDHTNEKGADGHHSKPRRVEKGDKKKSFAMREPQRVLKRRDGK